MGKIASFMLALSLIACGSDNKKKSPDAPVIDDAPIDARVCGSETAGAPTYLGFDSTNMVVAWSSEVPGGLDGKSLALEYDFYGTGPSLQGTFDLTMGDNANYKTCEICLLGYTYDPADQMRTPIKWFYPMAGSVMLAVDPYVTKHMMGSITGLQLQEVTIDTAGDFTSTPVAGGECSNYGSFTVDKDNVPDGWTCTHDKYQDGTTCDCACGVQDPDCDVDANGVTGCAGASQRCFQGACVDPPGNDTCALPGTLVVANGLAVTGTTIGANRSYDSGLETCLSGEAQPGPDVVYSVALTSGMSYTFTLSAVDATYDPSMTLVGPSAASTAVCTTTPITACVKGIDAGLEGVGETFTYTAGATDTYFVIIDSGYSGGPSSEGGFTLTVTQP